jgi:hypothetical protein
MSLDKIPCSSSNQEIAMLEEQSLAKTSKKRLMTVTLSPSLWTDHDRHAAHNN